MNLFQLEEPRPEGGATIPVTRLAELAEAWWGDGLAGLAAHTREQNQAILDRLGLTGEFWRL